MRPLTQCYCPAVSVVGRAQQSRRSVRRKGPKPIRTAALPHPFLPTTAQLWATANDRYCTHKSNTCLATAAVAVFGARRAYSELSAYCWQEVEERGHDMVVAAPTKSTQWGYSMGYSMGVLNGGTQMGYFMVLKWYWSL